MDLKLILTAAILAALFSIFSTKFPLFTVTTLPNSEDKLHLAEIVQLTGAFGPESIAFDPNGEGPYTGVADGRILKWHEDDRRWTEFAVTSSERKECVRPFAPEMEHVCGRPLGLRFDKKTGDLYIADAYFGLLVVGPAGGLAKQVVKEVEGQPLRFANDMDIDEYEDVIYFTDTSKNFQRREFISSLYTGDKTGRLIKYKKSSGEVTILLEDLAFANGVALSKDYSFVLVAETTACRIVRFWLKGRNAGKSEIFAELPGFPDNVRRNSKGEFWVALHAKRRILADLIVSKSWLGNTLLKLPLGFKQLHTLLVGRPDQATAIKLGEQGEVLQVLEDCEGKVLRLISEVEEKDGKLWIGSVMTPFIGIYNL